MPSIEISHGQRGGARQCGSHRHHDAPPVGVGAVQRGFDERGVRDPTRGRLHAASRSPARAPRTRATRGAPSPSATIMIASWRRSASSASPKRSSSSLSGSIATPLAPEAISTAVSLVESCPSTEQRSKERLTHTPSSRSAVCGLQRRVGLHEAEHRGEVRRDHPRPLALGAKAHGPRGQLDLQVGALLERVGRLDRLLEVDVALAAQLLRWRRGSPSAPPRPADTS